jgi:hypothetical protein
VEEAVRGAAHRATPGQLACLGNHPRGLRAGSRRFRDPAIVSAEIASELRRGAGYVRVTVALSVAATYVAD